MAPTTRLFRHRDFVDYLTAPLPGPLDERIRAVLADPALTGLLDPDDGGLLDVFGHRMAVLAVRRDSVEPLIEGLQAVMLAYRLDGDYQERNMVLAPLLHSALLLGLSSDDLAERLRAGGLDEPAIEQMVTFAKAQPGPLALRHMLLRAVGSGPDFDYVPSGRTTPRTPSGE